MRKRRKGRGEFKRIKRKEQKNNRNSTKHHIKPRSRGGGAYENILIIPESVHRAWHTIFGNLKVSEALQLIEIVFSGKGLEFPKNNWSQKDLYDLQVLLQLPKNKKEVAEEIANRFKPKDELISEA